MMPALVEFINPLIADEESASSPEQLTRATQITGLAFSDQAGTAYIEQSGDGTNWDINTPVNVTPNVGVSFEVDIVAQYWRIRYVNGPTDQGVFRLYAYPRDPYGVFLDPALPPSAGGAWGVLRWNIASNTYNYVGRFDGLDGFAACGAAAMITGQGGKYAAFLIDQAVVSEETILRATEHSPESF